VGRDGSPVLAKYPPKSPDLAPAGPRPAAAPVPPRPAAAAPVSPASAPPSPPATAAPAPLSMGLIALEPAFDVDEFARGLGENQIRVVVPREDLPEVLRRITDFMGFGIYVYSFRVHPADEETLKKFVVELQRVDFSPTAHRWTEFEEKGRSESPFGPDSKK